MKIYNYTRDRFDVSYISTSGKTKKLTSLQCKNKIEIYCPTKHSEEAVAPPEPKETTFFIQRLVEGTFIPGYSEKPCCLTIKLSRLDDNIKIKLQNFISINPEYTPPQPGFMTFNSPALLSTHAKIYHDKTLEGELNREHTRTVRRSGFEASWVADDAHERSLNRLSKKECGQVLSLLPPEQTQEC